MKEGYKKTELGWIPNEWEINKLSSISEIIMGQSPDSNSYNDEKIGIPFFQGKTEFGRINPIVKKWCSNPIKISQPQDILISVRAPVGEVNINIEESCIGRGLAAIRQKNCDYKFLFYYMQKIKNRLNLSAQGSTFTAINSGDLKNISIITPPLEEQQKIADILSTVDSQIDDTDKLIEKTKELKKGLMQRLLTKGIGHSEFKKSEVGEIPVEWEVKELSNISTIVDSLHETPNYVDSGYSMIRVVDVNGKAINTNSAFKVTKETYLKFIRKYEPQSGDIIMSRVGSYGLVSYLKDNEKVCLGQNIVVITTKLMDKSFLFYCLSSEYIKNEINKLTVGSSQKTLSLANINKLHVALPTIIEQKQIANILLSVDDQIEEYENKKIKLEQLKQGLMQQLLTGKIRVK